MVRIWILAVLGLGGCSDVIEQPTADVWEVDEVLPAVSRPEPTSLALPEPVDCAEPSRIRAADLLNTRKAMPVMTEAFGASGCVAERWIHTWSAELPLVEVYDFFDPEVAFRTYMIIEPYTHRWTYDGANRVVHEDRAHGVEEAPYFTDDTQYDAVGRITSRTMRSDPFNGFDGSVRRESWTFDGNSEEFAAYTLTQDGRVLSRQRREFDRGQIVAEFAADGDRPEALRVRKTLDDRGRVIEIETWDILANPETHAWIDRRADGTMRRKSQRHLQNRWWDVWEFDDAERLVLYTQDETEDGDIEYRQVKRYDAAGNTVFESTEYDFHRATTTYSEITRSYDEHGRLAESFDTPVWLDGDSQRVRYEYETGGGYTIRAERVKPSGDASMTAVTHMLDEDRLDWQRFDGDRDGELEAHERRIWRGQDPIERRVDNDGDGADEVVEQWHYDAAGQLAEHSMDGDGDGVADSRMLYSRAVED